MWMMLELPEPTLKHLFSIYLIINTVLAYHLVYAEMALTLGGSSTSMTDHLEVIQKAALRSADLTRKLLAFARKQTIAPKVVDLNDIIGSMLKMLMRLIGEDIDLIWICRQGHHL